MKTHASLIALALAAGLLSASGCALSGASDSGDSCRLTVSYTPDLLMSSPTEPIRAAARLENYAGVASYSWEIRHNDAAVAFTPATPDASQIDFLAPTEGIYQVRLTVQAGSGCPGYSQDVNVLQPGTSLRSFRLRVVPPAGSGDATPQDLSLSVPRGVDYAAGTSRLAVAQAQAGTVRSAGVAVPAYLRFTLSGLEREPVAEVMAGSQGGFTARLSPMLYDVLAVPTGDLAPFLVTRWDPATQLLGGPAGIAVSGSVRDPDDAPLAGARVSLKVGGVPSTVGTSDGAGAFALKVQPAAAGTSIELIVEPPAGSGLPRLRRAAAPGLELGAPLAIRYAAGLARRDLAGLLLARQGAAAPGAQVTFVAELDSAGTVGGEALGGVVRISATAGSDGRLPATRVPQLALSAVLAPAAGELAVLAFNGAAAPPAAIDAPAMRQLTGTVLTPAMARVGASLPAAGARVELVPQGALALAGVPAGTTVADSAGGFAAPAAPGGLYRAAITDPQGRGSRVVTAVVGAGALGEVALALGYQVTGKLQPPLAASPLRGASVQLYCGTCTGVTQPGRPYSEGVTGDDGSFVLIAPDEPTSANAP